MKTYIRTKNTISGTVNVAVNVPTPKEIQSSTKNEHYSVVISNFSDVRGENYCVASFAKTINAHLITMGFLFEPVTDKDVYQFKGKTARRAAIDTASEILVGRY